MQLLSITTVDNDGAVVKTQIENNEQLTSPLLTLLLDIPWNGTFLLSLSNVTACHSRSASWTRA